MTRSVRLADRRESAFARGAGSVTNRNSDGGERSVVRAVVMEWISAALDELERQPTLSYSAGQRPAAEPTAIATLALAGLAVVAESVTGDASGRPAVS